MNWFSKGEVDAADNESAASEVLSISTLAQPLIFRIEGSASLPVNSFDYRVSFIDFPPVDCSNNKFSIVFPAITEQLKSLKSPTLNIDAFDKNEFQARAAIDMAEPIAGVCKDLKKFPATFSFEKSSDLVNEASETIGVLTMKLILSCLGQTMCTEIKHRENSIVSSLNKSIPSKKSFKNFADDEYEEFLAEVNGHSLIIRMLKKQSNKKVKAICNSSSQVSSNSTNGPKYNLKTCQEASHQHLNTTINVKPCVNADVDDDSDRFSIVIGKRSESDRGRLEINLKAPKPLQPEDFKRPSRDAGIQTEVMEKTVKKGKEKKKVISK